MRVYTGRDAALRPIMYREMAGALQMGRRAYLLVPEQYTLEAEMEAMSALRLPGSFDFQVLSPARLFSRTFEAVGRPAQTRVDERGRVTLLSALMDGLPLTRYQNAQRRPGFVQRMAAEIARCKQTGLTAESLRRAAEEIGQSGLSDKLRDTACVWEEYEKALSGRFLDGEDERQRALERLPQADFLENASIWARGFELVSPALADILSALNGVCRETTLLIPCSRGRDKGCWEPVERSIQLLSQRFGGGMTLVSLPDPEENGSGAGGAVRGQIQTEVCSKTAQNGPKMTQNGPENAPKPARNGTETAPKTSQNGPKNDLQNGGLPGLSGAIRPGAQDGPSLGLTGAVQYGSSGGLTETGFFAREMGAYPARRWEGAPRQVSVFALKSTEEEADFAVGRVREWVRQNGWRYRDCAILCDNMAEYADRLNRAAELYHVPLFAEEQRCALSHPAAQYLLMALRLVRLDFPGDVCRLILRTGYTDLSDGECDVLSNYIYEFGIRGSLWRKPFARGKADRIQEAEPLRERFTAPFLALKGRLKGAKTARQILEALWSLAEETGVKTKLEARTKALFDQGMMVEASESAQVWNRIVGEFDQICELLGEQKMKAEDVERLLQAGLEASEISPLPQSTDSVCAASISRVRSRPFKGIVLIGASDAQPIRDEGLFDDGERQALSDVSGAWFPPDGDGRLRLRALDYKNAVSLAREKLTITYPLGPSGDRSSYGYPVRWAKRIFPDLADGDPEEALRVLYASAEAASVLCAGAKKDGAMAEERIARAAYAEAQAFCPTPPEPSDQSLEPTLARKLYGGPVSVNVYRLETFAACPFHYFVQYGLKPWIMRPFEYESRDRGTLVHKAMEAILRDPPDSPEEAARRAGAIVEELCRTEEGERMISDPLSPGLVAGLMRRAGCAADAAVYQLMGSAFHVEATELDFGPLSPLVFAHTNEGNIVMSGRIDRMDIWRDGRDAYVRVVDYKSSKSISIDLAKLYYGLQLQLPVYLAAACARENAMPAGAYYLPAAFILPKIESGAMDPASVTAARRREMALKGVTNRDPKVLSASSPNVNEVLGITLTKDNEPYKKGPLALPGAQLSALSHFALRKAGQLVDRMRRGEANVAPVRLGEDSSCKFCEFAAICRTDGKASKLDKLSKEEALGRILAEE